jgi:crotonobetainyl-CoA:carnitine CoA-transferase CaiB-like acyl-CoA transferase
MSGPLHGLRVVDLTEGWAGPFCTMELGDLGADVVKVEPPQGELTRRLGDPEFEGETLPFLAVNRSKRAICLDTTSADGRAVLHRLAASADVVVESMRPGEADERGIGYDALRATNPHLVYATITGFGQEGPYRDWACSELVAQAMSAMIPPSPGEEPVVLGGEQLSLFAGKYLFHGIVAALIWRARSGVAQRVDVSILEAGLARGMSIWPSSPEAPAARPPSAPMWATAVRAFDTADMPVEFNFRKNGYTPNDDAWQTFFGDVGANELIGDPRFTTEVDRTVNFGELKRALEVHLSRFSAYEIMELVAKQGGMAAPWHTLDGALAHAQSEALHMTATVAHPTLGALRTTASPYDFLGSPAEIRLAPPTFGQHTLEVLDELGYDHAEIIRLLEAGVVR